MKSMTENLSAELGPILKHFIEIVIKLATTIIDTT